MGAEIAPMSLLRPSEVCNNNELQTIHIIATRSFGLDSHLEANSGTETGQGWDSLPPKHRFWTTNLGFHPFWEIEDLEKMTGKDGGELSQNVVTLKPAQAFDQ